MTTSIRTGDQQVHPSDEDLLARLTATPERRIEMDRHLRRCADCTSRYVRLAALLDEVAGACDDAFEADLPAPRLAAQRARILRRLDRLTAHRPAPRILRFPDGRKRHAEVAAGARPWPTNRRLVAAAAALVAALGAGALLPFDREPAPAPPTEVMAAGGSSGSDEAFLNEVDLALRSPQVRELIPLDTVTPRVRTAAVDLW